MACQACELIHRDGVTGSTGCAVVIQKVLSERCGMVTCKDRRCPHGCVVALRTVLPECACMENRFRMAGGAIHRDLELTRRMALYASQLGVCPGQREGACIVVKGDVIPACRGMADRTILSELTVVMVIFCVT